MMVLFFTSHVTRILQVCIVHFSLFSDWRQNRRAFKQLKSYKTRERDKKSSH